MDINLPNANSSAVQNGMGFFELFLGIDAYSANRVGDTVKITTKDGTVEGSVSSVTIGPMGQFLGMGAPHVSAIGRAPDVRTTVDALEERYPAKVKGNEKALDPRTIYTAVYVSVPYVSPGMIPTPAPAVAA
ncbi:hypothetical protein [Methylorubrum extorquens]|uniref:hypothetical protein n=1 Tax=Methylorubrum extorquens TaxID=408 RepID=UPI00209FAFC4|nr:hypothetical protein [Methylorubrum extorquens]MCP1540128.1 hypothetical protein [Methylorubrum extorquens]